MTPIEIRIIDLDFPVGSKNKTATLITGEREAMLVDAGFTRADGHRLVAEVLDSGKALTKVFISHADPDYYWGAEVIADAFPDAEIVATPLVIEHIQRRLRGQAQGLGAGRCQPSHPPGRARRLTGDITFEGHASTSRAATGAARPPLPLAGRAAGDRRRRPALPERARLGRRHRHPGDRAVWIELLDEMDGAGPRTSPSPATGCPPAPCDASPIALHPRLPHRLRGDLASAPTAPPLTKALVARYPDVRHAHRRPARREGRQGRNDLGLTMAEFEYLRQPPPT